MLSCPLQALVPPLKKRPITALKMALSACVLAAAAWSPNVLADEYDDVTQLIRSGQLSQALSKADAHLGGKPRDPQMRFIKGVILTQTGKTNEAIELFGKLTQDYPELPEPHNNLAVLYAGQNQFDKARGELEMAIRTKPNYATAHENLGDVYAKLASQSYKKALQFDANTPGVQAKLALTEQLLAPQAKPAKP